MLKLSKHLAIAAILAFPGLDSRAALPCAMVAGTGKHFFCAGKVEIEEFKVVPKGNVDACSTFCGGKNAEGACNLVNGEICSFVGSKACAAAGGSVTAKDVSAASITSGLCMEQAVLDQVLHPSPGKQGPISWGRPATPEEFEYRKYTFPNLLDPAAEKRIANAGIRAEQDQEVSVHPTEMVIDVICRMFDPSGMELGSGQARASSPVKIEGNVITVLEAASNLSEFPVPARGTFGKCWATLKPHRLEARTDGKELRFYLDANNFLAAKPL